MPDSLITVFDRIRAAQEPAVPGMPDLGDVQGRVRRVRRRRRFVAAAAAACCLVAVAGVASQVRPGVDGREVVPAGPTASPGPTDPSTYGSLMSGTPPQRTANVAGTGFLAPEDLRHDDPVVTWQVEEGRDSDAQSLGLPLCLTGTGTLPTPLPGNSHYLVDGIGAERVYTAVVPEGRLAASELVLRLDARNEVLAADYLRQIVGCSRFEGDGRVLRATGSLLVMGVARPGTDTLSNLSVVLLSRGRLISITVDGRPQGTVAIPGGEQWLSAVASKAAERAAERGK